MVEMQVNKQAATFEPFYPSEKHLNYIRGKLMWALRGNDGEMLRVQRYINELAAGRYYNAIDVARKLGIHQSHASNYWRAIVAIGAIKRVEFGQMKPCLVHESELPVVIDFFERFKTLGRGWNATIKLIKESLRYSNGTNGNETLKQKEIGGAPNKDDAVYAAETVNATET